VSTLPPQCSSDQPRSFQTKQVLLVSAAHAFHDIFSGFVAPLLPLLIKRMSLSLTAAGGLIVVQRVPSLFNPLLGFVVDRLPLRPFVVFAPAITALAMCSMGWVRSWSGLAALLFVSGISLTLIHVPGPVMIAAYAGHRLGKGMSFFMVGGELARSFAPIVALFAVSLWSLEGLYRLMPLALLAAVLLRWLLAEPSDELRVRPRSGESAAAERATLYRVLIAATGIIAARSFMAAALTTFLPTYLTSRQVSLFWAGGALSLLQAAGTVGTFAAGTLSDRLGRRRVLTTVLVLSPLMMMAFLWATGIAVLPVLVGCGLLIFSVNPVLMAAIQDHAGSSPAVANGTYMTLAFALRALIILAVGSMGDAIGLERTFFWAGLLTALGVPFALALPRQHR
jgi:FSR family fosmidomycin resistance protein-like MFS transporter